MERSIKFLREVGLVVRKAPKGTLGDAFLPGIKIVDGELHVDTQRAAVTDILHDAGHLATIPTYFRFKANGDLSGVQKEMIAYLDSHMNDLATYPECEFSRALLQCGETEAIAWQYAASQAIGLPDELLFPPQTAKEIKENGSWEDTLEGLKRNDYLGINGLQCAGWTQVRPNRYMADKGIPVYPKLAYWLKDVPNPYSAAQHDALAKDPGQAGEMPKMRTLRP